MLRAPAPAVGVRGYWCEWWATQTESPVSRCLQSCPVASPPGALRWARIGLHLIASALDRPASGYVFDWLSADPTEAETALAHGEVFEFAVSVGDVRFEWSARPVVFLPLAGGAPVPHGAHGGAPWR